MLPGTPERATHHYKRHGTSSLYAALDIATGKVIRKLHSRHRAMELKKFPANQLRLKGSPHHPGLARARRCGLGDRKHAPDRRRARWRCAWGCGPPGASTAPSKAGHRDLGSADSFRADPGI
jgi:hypothetical protein